MTKTTIRSSEIHSRLEEWSGQVLPKSPMGKPVTYALGQWVALNRYVDRGILPIDNSGLLM